MIGTFSQCFEVLLTETVALLIPKRLTAPGDDRGSYYHELFLLGRPDLCRLMQRTRIKGNGMKAAASPNTEPKFYHMEPCVERDDMAHAHVDANAFDDNVEDIYIARGGRVEDLQQFDDEESIGGSIDESPAVVTPSSSHSGIFQYEVVGQDGIFLPLAERSITTKFDGVTSSKHDYSIAPSRFETITPSKYDPHFSSSKFEGLAPSKYDPIVSSSQAMTLASLLSPPIYQCSRLPPEDEWCLGRSDDISDCLDLGIMDDDVVSDDAAEEEDDDMLSLTETDDHINKIINKYCDDDVLVATQPTN